MQRYLFFHVTGGLAYEVIHFEQAFISFFFRQPKRKKPAVAQATNSKKRTKQVDPQTNPAADGDNDFNVPEPGDMERELLDDLADLAGVDDQAKVADDDEKVSKFRTQAVEEARSLGITLSDVDAETALGLFPKVLGSCYSDGYSDGY